MSVSILDTDTLHRKLSNKEVLVIVLIGLFAANFLNKGVIISILFFPIVIKKYFSQEVTRRSLVMVSLLTLFSIYYTIAAQQYGYTTNITVLTSYLISPVTMYLTGYILIKPNIKYKMSYGIIFIITSSTALFSILSIYSTIRTFGSLENASPIHAGRSVMSLWGENFIAATGMNTYVSLGIALFPLLFIKDKRLKSANKIKLLIFVCFITSLYVSLTLGNRTGLLILVMSSITVFLFSTKFQMIKIYKLIIPFFLIILSWLIYVGNYFGLRKLLEQSTIGERMIQISFFEDPRIVAWNDSFWGMLNYPLGGRETELSIKYAHNLWLDVARDVGVIPFLLLVIFSVFGILSLNVFLKKDHPLLLKGLVISSFTAILITCFLEPIMQGWFYYFSLFCLLLGMIHKHIVLQR